MGVIDMRIVVKIGTSTLAHPTGHLNIRRVEELCKIISDIKNAGHEVIVVSSGAIGMGVGKLGLRCRPTDIPTKQAAAAVGQCELMYTYDKLFSEYNHTVAHLLSIKSLGVPYLIPTPAGRRILRRRLKYEKERDGNLGVKDRKNQG